MAKRDEEIDALKAELAALREELAAERAALRVETEPEVQDNNAAIVSGLLGTLVRMIRDEVRGDLEALIASERRRLVEQVERLVGAGPNSIGGSEASGRASEPGSESVMSFAYRPNMGGAPLEAMPGSEVARRAAAETPGAMKFSPIGLPLFKP